MSERTKEARGDVQRRRAAHLGPERRRPLVLDAALGLFVERGYRGTAMEAIAEAAGVTKPVVYECYPSKAELFRALLEREERRLLEAVAAALPRDASAADVEPLAVGAFTALLRAAAAAPDSWRVVFASEHGAEPEIRRRFRRGREAVIAQLAALLAELLEARGRVDRRLAAALAELLASLGEGGVRLLLADGSDWTAEELGLLLGRLSGGALAAAGGERS
jgi:AcrR family transcriptional regulator